MIYVDTSVLAAYYCPEEFSDLAQAELTGQRIRVLSRLVELELCSALSLKARSGQLSLASANRVLSIFEVHKSAGAYQWVEIGPAEYRLACQWVSRFTTPLRSLDALHLAAAFVHELTLLTSDLKLSRAADHLGVPNRLLARP